MDVNSDVDHRRSREQILNDAKSMSRLSGEKFVRQVEDNPKGEDLIISGVCLDLSDVVFARQMIRGVVLQHCVVIGADFEGFVVDDCSFESCVFIDPNFHQAHIARTRFIDVLCIGDTGDLEEDLSPHVLGSFERSRLYDCLFVDVTFQNIRACGINADRIEMHFCDFSGSQLADTEILRSSIVGCNFSNAGLRESRLKDTVVDRSVF